MSGDEARGFLGQGTRTGTLAVVRRDGLPMVAPIRVDERPPYAFVRVDGTARAERDAPDILRRATTIAAREVGAEAADAFGRCNAAPGEMLVRVRPAHVVAHEDIAG